MKASAIIAPALLAILHGCAASDAGSVAYAIAADVEKSECRALAEPRQSACLDDLDRRMEAQKDLAEEMARERNSQQK